MRTFSELTKDQLTEAHDSADKLISEKYRSYLPGRLLSLLLSRYRDDLAEALRMPLPELPHRAGPVSARVPGAEYLRDERAGGPRPLRPPGKRHALPDRRPSHHRTRPFPGRPAPGNRPGSGRTHGNARSAQP